MTLATLPRPEDLKPKLRRAKKTATLICRSCARTFESAAWVRAIKGTDQFICHQCDRQTAVKRRRRSTPPIHPKAYPSESLPSRLRAATAIGSSASTPTCRQSQLAPSLDEVGIIRSARSSLT